MKFTSIAVLAVLFASTSAVHLVKKDDNSNGVAYALDVPTLRGAEADNAAKTQAHNGATASQATAANNHAVASAAADATAAAATAAAAAKAGAETAHQLGGYKGDGFAGNRDAYEASLKTNEAALDAKLKAFDDQVEKTHILNRKNRDLAAATSAKDASDANLKNNQDRVANEKDQLERGENQDRLKTVNQNSAAKVSEIQGKHDERERANGRLFKAVASF